MLGSRLTRPLVVALIAGVWLGLAAPRPAVADAGDDRAQRRRAASLTHRASRHYHRGRFEQALALYGRAYRLVAAPELLFNLGQCHRNLGDDRRAIWYYESYLRERPDAANRELVEELIEEARARTAEPTPRRFDARAAAAVVATGPPPEPAVAVDLAPRAGVPLHQRWWLWATALGVIATGATIAIGVMDNDEGSPPARRE